MLVSTDLLKALQEEGLHQQGLLHIKDPIAIGAFHAAEKGVLVVQSAGNSGLAGFQSVASVAPWILSVAASTTDRHFVNKVVLGNGKTLTVRTISLLN
ncbi:hypothetical protein Goklo_013011, partial [Gossypium klotzschianum]|nr:hypothetical protein [Gossypium klotzschianum]